MKSHGKRVKLVTHKTRKSCDAIKKKMSEIMKFKLTDPVDLQIGRVAAGIAIEHLILESIKNRICFV
jgi:hypothetical protein